MESKRVGLFKRELCWGLRIYGLRVAIHYKANAIPSSCPQRYGMLPLMQVDGRPPAFYYKVFPLQE